MRTISMTVGMGMTVPDPKVPYQNFKPNVEFTATLDEGDSEDQAYLELKMKVLKYVSNILKAVQNP